jgi:alpha-beta hydrolase superfamily lysophospholipase
VNVIPQIEQFTAHDGYPLHARVWRSASPPAARVVGLHGIISHSGWYARSCAFLASAGYEVHFLDRRGSGLNAKQRGDIDCWRIWLDDVENYLDWLGGDAPRILMGISWGGKLAAAVARHRPWLLDGLALLCPGIRARTKASAVQRQMLKLADRIGLKRRRVTIPLQDPALFIDDPAWQEYIGSDPLVLREITLRLANEDLKLDAYVADAAPHLCTPTLLMLAGRDQIIDNEAMRAFFEQLSSSQKRLIEYPQAAHTLEFEPDTTSFFNDLSGWIVQTARSARQSNQ